ncbi:MAG: hypothetical protein GYA23_13060 [Methanomicrobiales archaeon]|nr:hypothetical protein [Methanomicrobiales archaeon]
MGFFWRKKTEERVCPNCKKPFLEGTPFCESCGLRVTPPPACGKCQLPLAPDTNFCESCGTPVGIKPAPEPESEPGPQPQAAPAENMAGHQKDPHPRGKKGRKRGKPKKDEFVLRSMITPGAGADAQEPGQVNPVPPPREEKAAEQNPAPQVGASAATTPAERLPTIRNLPKKLPKKTLLLSGIIILFLLVAAAVLSGFIHLSLPAFHHTPGGKIIPVPVTQPTEMPESGEHSAKTTSTIPSLVPGPTQVPPESGLIWLQAERDPITNIVSVIFNGGKGQRAVREVQVRLTRSDGQVLERTFKPLTVGEGATLQGTKFTDRLEVNVTYNNGEAYTVIDKLFEYKQRN